MLVISVSCFRSKVTSEWLSLNFERPILTTLKDYYSLSWSLKWSVVQQVYLLPRRFWELETEKYLFCYVKVFARQLRKHVEIISSNRSFKRKINIFIVEVWYFRYDYSIFCSNITFGDCRYPILITTCFRFLVILFLSVCNLKITD